jgi:transcriptional regulator with XRE-family HTH domain
MEGDLQRTLGRNLRAYRKAQGLSQEAFAAEVLGPHRTYVGGIERGERNLSLKSVERIAERLDVDPLSLLTDQGNEPPDKGPPPQTGGKRQGAVEGDAAARKTA